jgi:hypothetical protein
MPELVALRAAFGQDEANHGTERYCVERDGLVRVPPEAVPYLTRVGGFALAAVGPRQRPNAEAVGTIRLHHDGVAACSYGGRRYVSDANGDVEVPAEAAAELFAHGYVPAASAGSVAVRSARRAAVQKAVKE